MLRSLFSILGRFGVFFLFVAMEGLCFFLVVRFNTANKVIFFSSANRITGLYHEQMERLSDFMQASDVADSLWVENARLERQFDKYKDNTATEIDSVYNESSKQLYTVYGAKVINNSINRTNNYLVLNKGKEDTISKDMGVITDAGIVGIVVGATEHYSLVMSLLHLQTRISAKIKSNGYFGPLVWEGLDPTRMRLEDIPKHAELSKKDTVVTSGYSTMFPADVLVGTIDSFWIEPGSNFYSIEVKLSEDLSNVNYVYVVRHLQRNELEELQQQVANE